MKVKLVKKKNPQKVDEQKFYAQAVKLGVKNTKDLSEEISGRCSLTRGDVLNVLANLNEVVTKWLIEGYSVRLDNLGTLRVTLLSKGSDTAVKDISNLIKRARVRFLGDNSLSEEVNHNITYESSTSIKV